MLHIIKSYADLDSLRLMAVYAESNLENTDYFFPEIEDKTLAVRKVEEGFLTFLQETLGESVKEVRFSANLGDLPVAIVPEAGMSFEMEKYMKRANPEFAFSVGRILELNGEHDAVKAIERAMAEDPMKAGDYAKLLCCQAQLMAELPLEDPYAYTELVCKLMK